MRRTDLLGKPKKTIIIDQKFDCHSDIDSQPIEIEECHQQYQESAHSNLKPEFSLLKSFIPEGFKQKSQIYKPSIKQQIIAVSQSSESESESEESVVILDAHPRLAIYTKKKLRKMATVPNKVKLERKDESSLECSICLTDLKEKSQKKIGKLPCKHVFCVACILESAKFSNRCPYCRSTFFQIYNGKKIIQVEQTHLNQEFDDPQDQPCYVCGRNDDFDRLLQCEYCEYAYCHTYCDDRLHDDQPPAQSWYCRSCELIIRQNEEMAMQIQE